MRTFDHKTSGRGAYRKTSQRKRRKKTSGEFYWVFCAVVCFMFGLASFLMFSAWDRFSGVAWGNVDGGEIAFEEGFITIDMSDSHREALLAYISSDESEMPDALETAETGLVRALQDGADQNAVMKGVMKQEGAAQESDKAGTPGEGAASSPPQVSAVASLPLPSRRVVMEDFGPMPRYLSGYEDIVLSLHEDGTRLPEDSEEEEEDGDRKSVV